MGISDIAKQRGDDFQKTFVEEGAETAFQLEWSVVEKIAGYTKRQIEVKLAMSRAPDGT